MRFGKACAGVFPVGWTFGSGVPGQGPLNKLLLRWFDQHHAANFLRIHAGKNAIQWAPERMSNQHIGWRDVRVLKGGMELARDLARIARRGPGRRISNAGPIICDRAREPAYRGLHKLPRRKSTSRRPAPSRFKYHSRTAMAANEHVQPVAARVDIGKGEPSRIHRQHNRDPAGRNC